VRKQLSRSRRGAHVGEGGIGFLDFQPTLSLAISSGTSRPHVIAELEMAFAGPMQGHQQLLWRRGGPVCSGLPPPVHAARATRRIVRSSGENGKYFPPYGSMDSEEWLGTSPAYLQRIGPVSFPCEEPGRREFEIWETIRWEVSH
jgi:hypothetical protein